MLGGAGLNAAEECYNFGKAVGDPMDLHPAAVQAVVQELFGAVDGRAGQQDLSRAVRTGGRLH